MNLRKHVFGWPWQRRRTDRRSGRTSLRRRLWLEALEERTLLSISISGLPDWTEAGPRPIDNAQLKAPPNSTASGNVQVVAIDPNHPSNLWVGTVNGGVWRTTNAQIFDPTTMTWTPNPNGIQWTPLTDRLPSLAVSAVAVDPLDSSGNTVWAGTGEYTAGGAIAPPALAKGLWRTTDGGVIWAPLGQNIVGSKVKRVLPTGILGPGGKEVVLVATLDPHSDGTYGGGLFRSTDGGASFKSETDPGGATGLPAGSGVMDLIQDPNAPGTFYATVPSHGVYISTDGTGASWKPFNNGLTNITAAGAIHIAAHAQGGTVLYAQAFGETINKIFTFTNGATMWTPLADPPPAAIGIAADPTQNDVAYIAASGNIYRFDPAGSWVQISGADANNQPFAKDSTAPHVDDHDIVFLVSNNPNVPDTLVESDDGGIYCLTNPTNPFAVGWQSLGGNLGNVEFYHTALDTKANVVFGASQDNGVSVQTLPTGFSGSQVWNWFQGGDGTSVAYDGIDHVRYAISNDLGGFTRYDASGHATPVAMDANSADVANGVRGSGLNSTDLAFELGQAGAGLTPVATNAAAGSALLFAGLTGVYESTNHGDIITDITSNLKGFDNSPFSLLYGGSRAGLPQANVAYVGTWGGQLYFRGESGANFTLLTGTGTGQLPGGQAIWSIAADPEDWRRVYVVRDDNTVWTCDNVIANATDPVHNPFRNITGNLGTLTNTFRSIVLFDNTPNTPGDSIPLVGAFGGVYRLLGTTWTLYGDRLPNVIVSDVRYYPRTGSGLETGGTTEQVLAGTFGRGAWQLFNPSGTVATPSVLQINGDTDFANENDVIKLQLDPNNPTLLNVFLNSPTPTRTFQLANIQAIDVNGLGGNNTIIVDFSNGAFSVPGGIAIDGGTGVNQLKVVGGNAAGDSIQVTGSTVTVDGVPISYTRFSGLEVDALGSATGSNSFEVQSTSTNLTINPGKGSNQIDLGIMTGNLDSITGAVTINPGLGSDFLNLFDQKNTNAETWGIGGTSVFRGFFSLSYLDNPVLTVYGGGGNNFFEVGGTSGPTTVNAGNGTNSFLVGYSGLRAVLRVSGGSGTDTLTILDTNNNNSAWAITNHSFQGGGGAMVNYGGLKGVTLDGGNGANIYSVFSSAATAPFTLNTGTGNDLIFITLPGLQSAVTVNGQGGADQLSLNDSGNTAAMGYDLSAGSLVRLANTFLPTVFYNHLAGLTLNVGSGTDHVTVESTAANAPATVNAGAGADTINLASPSFGSLAFLLAPVTVNGQAGGTTLTLNDQGNTTATEYDISAGSVGRFRGSSLPSIFYSNIHTLTLNAGSGNNSFFVETTAATTPVTVNTGAGNDTINLGFFASLAGLLAPVTVNGQGGTDQMILFDQLNKTGTFYDISSFEVVRISNTFLPTILYSGLAGLTLNAGGGANRISVETTTATTPVTVNTGAGNDTINLGTADFNLLAGIRAAVTVNGQGGTDQLFLNDQGNTTTADQVTGRSTGVTSTNPGSFFPVGGSLTYSGISTVNIFTSNTSKGSTITVFPASGMVFNIFGAGQPAAPGNSLTVQPLNGTVLTQHTTGTGAGNYTLPTSSTILVSYSDMQSVTPVGLLAVGSGPGLASEVKVYDPQSGALKYDLHPFRKSFLGGVRVAVGDVNGDGIPDIVAAEGPGGGTVRVFDGSTGKPLAGPLGRFTPFGPKYTRGLWVAAADVNGDGFADVIVGQDAGGQPEVRVYSGKDGSLLADFLAFDKSFPGGVRVAAAVIKGHHDVITGQGPGGQIVNVFDGATLNLTNNTPTPAFTIAQPFGPTYSGGVFVGTGDVYGDGTPKILVGQGVGQDPQIGIFDATAQGKELKSFVVYGFPNGVRVAAADLNGDSRADVIAGEAQGGSNVRAYDGLSLQEDGHLNAFSAASPGGVFVGGFGHWGDFANVVGKTTGGAQGILQTVLVDLTSLQATLTNSAASQKLVTALDALFTAFNSPAWADDGHLRAASGQSVFAEIKLGVDVLAGLIQSSPTVVPVPRLEQDIGQVLTSEEVLVVNALFGAARRGSRAIQRAQVEFVAGLIDTEFAFLGGTVNLGLLDGAMDHFLNAWQDLQ